MAPGTGRSRAAVVLGVIGMVAVAGGWFVLSVRVAHTSPRTAVGEAVGVMLAVLLAVSIVGSMRSRQ
jgi:hypothetical protein